MIAALLMRCQIALLRWQIAGLDRHIDRMVTRADVSAAQVALLLQEQAMRRRAMVAMRRRQLSIIGGQYE